MTPKFRNPINRCTLIQKKGQIQHHSPPFITIRTIQDEKFDEMGKGSHLNKVLTSNQTFKAIQEDHSRPFTAIQGHSRSFEAIQNHSAQFIAIQSYSGAF